MEKTFLVAAMIFLVSCGNKSKQDQPKENDTTSTTQNSGNAKYNPDSLLGDYIGGFGKNTIILSVNYINGKKAAGYNVLKGNRRNLKGTVADKGPFFEFELTEPGGDENDGKFIFTIDTANKALEGTWVPNDTIKLKSKQFKLTKRKFQHEDTEGIIGFWYLNDLRVEFKANKTGIAKGPWRDENYEILEEVNIPFSWFDEKKAVTLEWSKNNIFPSSKMKFKLVKDPYEGKYEEMLQSDNYIMYRY